MEARVADEVAADDVAGDDEVPDVLGEDEEETERDESPLRRGVAAQSRWSNWLRPPGQGARLESKASARGMPLREEWWERGV